VLRPERSMEDIVIDGKRMSRLRQGRSD